MFYDTKAIEFLEEDSVAMQKKEILCKSLRGF